LKFCGKETHSTVLVTSTHFIANYVWRKNCLSLRITLNKKEELVTVTTKYLVGVGTTLNSMNLRQLIQRNLDSSLMRSTNLAMTLMRIPKRTEFKSFCVCMYLSLYVREYCTEWKFQ